MKTKSFFIILIASKSMKIRFIINYNYTKNSNKIILYD